MKKNTENKSATLKNATTWPMFIKLVLSVDFLHSKVSDADLTES